MMYLIIPSDLGLYFIDILALLLPSLLLVDYVYRKEILQWIPKRQILILFTCGILAALLSVIIELHFESLLNSISVVYDTVRFQWGISSTKSISANAAKLLLLGLFIWKWKPLNSHVQLVFYSLMISLGFILYELVSYCFLYGIEMALMASFLSIPMHLSFGIYLGIYAVKIQKPTSSRVGKIVTIAQIFLLLSVLHTSFIFVVLLGEAILIPVFMAFSVLYYKTALSDLRAELE